MVLRLKCSFQEQKRRFCKVINLTLKVCQMSSVKHLVGPSLHFFEKTDVQHPLSFLTINLLTIEIQLDVEIGATRAGVFSFQFSCLK